MHKVGGLAGSLGRLAGRAAVAPVGALGRGIGKLTSSLVKNPRASLLGAGGLAGVGVGADQYLQTEAGQDTLASLVHRLGIQRPPFTSAPSPELVQSNPFLQRMQGSWKEPRPGYRELQEQLPGGREIQPGEMVSDTLDAEFPKGTMGHLVTPEQQLRAGYEKLEPGGWQAAVARSQQAQANRPAEVRGYMDQNFPRFAPDRWQRQVPVAEVPGGQLDIVGRVQGRPSSPDGRFAGVQISRDAQQELTIPRLVGHVGAAVLPHRNLRHEDVDAALMGALEANRRRFGTIVKTPAEAKQLIERAGNLVPNNEQILPDVDFRDDPASLIHGLGRPGGENNEFMRKVILQRLLELVEGGHQGSPSRKMSADAFPAPSPPALEKPMNAIPVPPVRDKKKETPLTAPPDANPRSTLDNVLFYGAMGLPVAAGLGLVGARLYNEWKAGKQHDALLKPLQQLPRGESKPLALDEIPKEYRQELNKLPGSPQPPSEVDPRTGQTVVNTSPTVPGKLWGTSESLGEHVQQSFERVGGKPVYQKAVNRAQAQQANRGSLTTGAQRILDAIFPKWKPEQLDKRHGTVWAAGQPLLDSKGTAGITITPPGKEPLVMVGAEKLTEPLSPKHLPENTRTTLMHELGHATYHSGKETGTIKPDPRYVAPVLSQIGVRTNDPKTQARVQEMVKYLASSSELDARMTEMLHQYRQHAGKVVNTPQEAASMIEWWKQRYKAAPAMRSSRSLWDLYDLLPAVLKEAILHRATELVKTTPGSKLPLGGATTMAA